MTIFINFDVETTGQTPTHHDLLSLGAVADVAVADDLTDLRRVPGVGEFSVNIQMRGGPERWDPGTMAWWRSTDENKEALRLTLQEPRREPVFAMKLFMDWIETVRLVAEDMMTAAGRKSWEDHCLADGHHSPIVFVAYPIVFDMSWLRHYAFTYEYERFSKLGWSMFSGWDLLTHNAVLQQVVPYLTRRIPGGREVMEPFHTPQHVALNDARAQAAMFKHMLKASKTINDGYVFQLVRQGAFVPSLEPPQVVHADGTTEDL